jgi:polysaccharide export outer membrane protein
MRLAALLLLPALALAACGNLPRGAGLQREVLAHSAGSDPATDPLPTEFAVEPITRASLSRYAGWPLAGSGGPGWPGRADRPASRIIAPGDTVAVMVWNTEDNSLLANSGERSVALPPAQVGPDGRLFLPYIGQVELRGLTPEAARTKIEAAYAKVMPSAQVQITLTEGRQSSVSVVTGVKTPGSYPLADQDTTVLEVLALAGGADSFKNPQLRLQRGSRTYGIALSRVLKDASLDATLRGGDRVFLEEDSRYFLSLGAAGSRAQHPFPQEHLSALDALSIIGGVEASRANAQGILILRDYPAGAVRTDGSGPRHQRTIFTIDLTSADGLFSAGQFRIGDGDLIYVTESPLIGTRNVFGLIGSAFGLATQIDNAGS